MFSRDAGGFSRTNSYYSEHNAARSVIILKRRVIKYSLVIGCNDKKKKFVTQACFRKMFL